MVTHWMRVDVIGIGQMNAKANVMISMMIETNVVSDIRLNRCDGGTIVIVIEQPYYIRL
jgi:hypothetical protein